MCVYGVCVCAAVSALVYVGTSMCRICQSFSGEVNQQAAQLQRGAPALGEEADRVKTHPNTAVIFP